MISTDNTILESLVLHKIGNKNEDEGITFSKAPIKPGSEVSALLLHYFFSPFKESKYWHFTHETDPQMNEVYSYVSAIFDNPDSLYDQSLNIAKHLYEQSSHPKIRPGELYTVYFRNCIIEGEMTDAVGIFKSESRDTFLRINISENGEFDIAGESGININRLDKGCLVFNSMREEGFIVAAVDNVGKGSDAAFWTDDFLHITRRKDQYYKTEEVIQMCKDFATEKLPEESEISRAEQAEMLNDSNKYFNDNETFSVDELENEVFKNPDVRDSFRSYRKQFEDETGTSLDSDFDIAEEAVKKKKRILRSVIKLDNNFRINVIGGTENIRKGFDQSRGMNYYTLYFNEEN